MNILRKSVAIFILICCLFCMIAILDYHIEDPSYLHVTDNHVSNITSSYGANIADPIIQAFGYTILIPLSIISIGCIMFMSNKNIQFICLKLSILIMTMPLFCFLVSIFDSNDIVDAEYYTFHYAGYLGYFLYSEILYSERFNLYTSIICCSTTIAIIFILGGFEKLINIKKQKNINTTSHNMQQTFEQEKIDILFNPEIKFKIKESDLMTYKSFDINTIIKSNNDKNNDKHKKNSLYNNNQVSFETSKNILSTDILPLPNEKTYVKDENDIVLKKNELLKILNDFGIRGEIVNIHHGPVVTLYCFEPVAGIKSSRIIGLSDDIARSMKAKSARISIIKGKNAIGIELPNVDRQIITLREILESEEYKMSNCQLPLALGKNITGEVVIGDLAKMPHLLVAGTTGSGKSVAIHSMILSLIFKYQPHECKFIIIDPKMLEMSSYMGLPHLFTPVVTEVDQAINTMNWVVNEMSARYRAMSTLGVRNITSYNNLISEAKDRNAILEKQVQTGFDNTNQPMFEAVKIQNEIFPYIVVIIDEVADLMLTTGKEIEASIQRLAQMARAAGIHLIMATQRPSVDVITGVIKANFPTRISFQVASRFDSRTILGEIGAEHLLGMGDMLYMTPGGKIERVHGTYITELEIQTVVEQIKFLYKKNT